MTDPRIETAANLIAGRDYPYYEPDLEFATEVVAAIDKAATITEQAQIDALLPGSVVIDAGGGVWKRGTGSWVGTSEGGDLEPQAKGARVVHWGTA